MEHYNLYLMDELYHHGVKGQKWGVRRYQNYDGSLTTAGKKHVKNSPSRNYNSMVDSGKKHINGINTEKGFDPFFIEAGFFTTLAAIKFINEIRDYKRKNETIDDLYKKRKIKTLREIPRLKEPMSASESMKIVNPGFPKKGTYNNCMMCTTAMVMREKGYDVKAVKTYHGFIEPEIDQFFGSGGKFKTIAANTSKEVVDTLTREGDGAYGNFTFTWDTGGGHSVFWKNENGKTRIYDGQSGEEYDINNSNSDLLQHMLNSGAYYSRLDNVDPTEKVLAALARR